MHGPQRINPTDFPSMWFTLCMAMLWELSALPPAFEESHKVGRAHIPALPCAYMKNLRQREQQKRTPKRPYEATSVAFHSLTWKYQKEELAEHKTRVASVYTLTAYEDSVFSL